MGRSYAQLHGDIIKRQNTPVEMIVPMCRRCGEAVPQAAEPKSEKSIVWCSWQCALN